MTAGAYAYSPDCDCELKNEEVDRSELFKSVDEEFVSDERGWNLLQFWKMKIVTIDNKNRLEKKIAVRFIRSPRDAEPISSVSFSSEIRQKLIGISQFETLKLHDFPVLVVDRRLDFDRAASDV